MNIHNLSRKIFFKINKDRAVVDVNTVPFRCALG